MGNKYQVLANIHGESSVIERIGDKDRWKVTVPNAGDPTMAIHLARLLNDENEKLLESRRSKEADGLV